MQIFKMPIKLVIALFFNVFVLVPVQAQEVFNGVIWGRERGGELKQGGGFGINHYHVMLPVIHRKKDREGVQIYANIERQSISWGDNSNAYNWLSAKISYKQERNSVTDLIIEFEPGLMSDFAKLSEDAIFANLLFAGRTRLRSNIDVLYGVTVNRRFGNADPYPVLQVQWYPLNNTEVLLGYPDNRIQTYWSNSLSSYLKFSSEGGIWHESSSDKSKQGDASYTNTRVGLGALLYWRKNFWFTGEIGQNMDRKFRAFNKAGVKQNLEVKNSTYWQIGLRLNF